MLYIIRGLPGSGKSTFANRLKSAGVVDMVCEADDFFVEPYTGVYMFEARLIPTAHKVCQERVKEALEHGYSVAVSNTFTRKWEVQPYLDMAVQTGHRFQIIKMEGNFGNIHDVPEDVIDKMRERWEDMG